MTGLPWRCAPNLSSDNLPAETRPRHGCSTAPAPLVPNGLSVGHVNSCFVPLGTNHESCVDRHRSKVGGGGGRRSQNRPSGRLHALWVAITIAQSQYRRPCRWARVAVSVTRGACVRSRCRLASALRRNMVLPRPLASPPHPTRHHPHITLQGRNTSRSELSSASRLVWRDTHEEERWGSRRVGGGGGGGGAGEVGGERVLGGWVGERRAESVWGGADWSGLLAGDALCVARWPLVYLSPPPTALAHFFDPFLSVYRLPRPHPHPHPVYCRLAVAVAVAGGAGGVRRVCPPRPCGPGFCLLICRSGSGSGWCRWCRWCRCCRWCRWCGVGAPLHVRCCN